MSISFLHSTNDEAYPPNCTLANNEDISCMTEEDVMKVEKRQDIILRPERIQLTRSDIRLVDSMTGRYKIPYKELLAARIRIKNQISGVYYEPEITEISRDMRGDLIFYDRRRYRWQIQMDLIDQAAGAILVKLAVRAPYIFLGRESIAWSEQEEQEAFAGIVHIVEMMRQSGEEPCGEE